MEVKTYSMSEPKFNNGLGSEITWDNRNSNREMHWLEHNTINSSANEITEILTMSKTSALSVVQANFQHTVTLGQQPGMVLAILFAIKSAQ